MKVDVYLYRQIVPDIEYLAQINMIDHELKPTYIGYVNVKEFNEYAIVTMCHCKYISGEPSILHSIIGPIGPGLMFIHPETGDRYLVKSKGFLVGDEDTINKYVEENRYQFYWR